MAKSDYIKREDATEVYSKLYWMHEGLLNFQEELGKVYDEILGIPSADVAPVIRCKDCDYWNELEKGVGVCKRLVEAMWVDYTDFCSFAENKDDITYGEREDDDIR